ncbi:MAG: GHKL domain-containing protein [Bacteroidetes bacterium]|nr:GHKL domain-containing protein [Bacteroidota bacterium]
MSLQIAPLILISFIENAFKHSRHTINGQVYIKGDIKVNGSVLTLDLENSYNPEMQDVNLVKREGGVGLEITNKRLQMLYFDKYKIDVNEDNGIYKLNLQIQL